MQSIKEASVSGAKWGAIEKFAIQGVRFLLGIVMARLLSPSDYGTVSMIIVFIAISETFVDSGFGNALIQKKDPTPEDYSTVFYFNIVIAILCYGVLFVSAPFVADFFNIPILCWVLRIQSLTLLINSLLTIQVNKLTKDLNFKVIAKCNVISSVSSCVLGVVLAYMGFGLWALVAQTLMAAFLNLICVTYWGRWRPQAGFSFASLKGLFSFGINILLNNLINRIFQNLTTIIIGKLYSAKDLGVYDRGASLTSFFANNVNEILSKISLPILSRIQDDDLRLLGAFRKYMKFISMIIFFVTVLIAALGKPIILFLLTDKWAESIIYLQTYSFCVMFNHADSLCISTILSKGYSKSILKLQFIKKPITLLLILGAAPMGVIGICFAMVLQSQFNLLCDSYYTKKYLNYGYLNLIKDIFPYLLAALLSCIPAYLLSTYSLFPNLLTITVGAVLAIIFYIILLNRSVAMKDVMTIIQPFIKKVFGNQ